jgi:glycosyltransferase involved in cell wall biosynthesis
VPYPYSQAPSQRFRYEQYLGFMKEDGLDYKICSFLDENTWSILYKPGHTFRKVSGIIKGFAKRFIVLLNLRKYDFIFIHREATPIGPPIFEWIIAKVFQKKIIYDFDDAIWIPNTSSNNKIVAAIKWHSKVRSICRWAYKISCGNEFLQEYASLYNSNAYYVPTTIDTDHKHNPDLYRKVRNSKPVIGWTGTHSTLIYLNEILPALKLLEKKFEFELCVIANQDPKLPLKYYNFIAWNKETEIQDLLRFDIGLMPLTNDEWAEGKCGFKALQYMALNIPALVSPIGVNISIIKNGHNGYLCENEVEWFNSLSCLLQNYELIKKIGISAREKVISSYSINSNRLRFLELFV